MGIEEDEEQMQWHRDLFLVIKKEAVQYIRESLLSSQKCVLSQLKQPQHFIRLRMK